jgi:hypothetical protein
MIGGTRRKLSALAWLSVLCVGGTPVFAALTKNWPNSAM